MDIRSANTWIDMKALFKAAKTEDNFVGMMQELSADEWQNLCDRLDLKSQENRAAQFPYVIECAKRGSKPMSEAMNLDKAIEDLTNTEDEGSVEEKTADIWSTTDPGVFKTVDTWSKRYPEMQPVEYAEFKESIKTDGMKTPINVLADMTVWDGHHRLLAATELINEGVAVDILYITWEIENPEEVGRMVDIMNRHRRSATTLALVKKALNLKDEMSKLEKEKKKQAKANKIVELPAKGTPEYKQLKEQNKKAKEAAKIAAAASGKKEKPGRGAIEKAAAAVGTKIGTVQDYQSVVSSQEEFPEIAAKVEAEVISPSKGAKMIRDAKKAKAIKEAESKGERKPSRIETVVGMLLNHFEKQAKNEFGDDWKSKIGKLVVHHTLLEKTLEKVRKESGVEI